MKSVPLILLSVCQSIETLFLIHDLHITSGAGPLFYLNDQHNILMWSSKLCWVRINRIFSILLNFFSPLLVPLNPNFSSLPLMTFPRAVGELQPGKRPRLFHEIFWFCGRASISWSQSETDSALQSGTGLESSDP